MQEELDERADQSVPSEFIVCLMEQVLENNIFEFDKQLFLQEIGSAMGTVAAPNYSNLFMSNKIDQRIRRDAAIFGEGTYPLCLFKKFIDDLFLLWVGSVESHQVSRPPQHTSSPHQVHFLILILQCHIS